MCRLALLAFLAVPFTLHCASSSGRDHESEEADGGDGGQGGEASGGEAGQQWVDPGPPELDDDLPLEPVPGLAPTPPMGWNSWNKFACNVTAEMILEMADAMVESGMRDAGYTYINIDDCWAEVERNPDGSVQPVEGFPDGIAPVADYIHDLGLRLGIYSDRGHATCAGRAGSEGYETEDATAYASWGVDYLKYDNCNATLPIEEQYRTMSEALSATGRDIVFSLCAWQFYEWGIGLGQLWRTTTDIRDRWESVYANILNNVAYAPYAGPNGFNDPDMLEVGNGGLSDTEYRTHVSLWAISAAPLIAGNDLRTMSDATRTILMNEEVIAINQDALGIQGVPVSKKGELLVFSKPLNESGTRAVVMVNGSNESATLSFTAREVGLRDGWFLARDLWAHEDLGEFRGEFSAEIPAHGERTLRLTGSEPTAPSGEVWLSELPWVYAANNLGPVERDRSNGATAAFDGTPLTLDGTEYEKGLGVSAASLIIYRLAQKCQRFTATVGLDDSTNGQGSVVFSVIADGEELYKSPVMTSESQPEELDLDVTDRRRLRLLVTSAGDGSSWDRADWAEARLECDE